MDQHLEGVKVLAYDNESRQTVKSEYDLLLRVGGAFDPFTCPLMLGRPVGKVGGSASATAGIETVRGRGGAEAGGVGRARIGNG